MEFLHVMRKKIFFFIALSLVFLVSSCSATKFLMNYASGDDRKPGKIKDWVYTTQNKTATASRRFRKTGREFL